MSKKTNLAIWIPVIITFITSLTTLGVTYINATVKADKQNVENVNKIKKYRSVRPSDMNKAQVRFTTKGLPRFVVSTNK